MKFGYKLNDKGNETERISFDVLNSGRGDQRYLTTYESYDEKGNWTRSSISKLIKEGDNLVYTLWYVFYRTITYH